MEEERMENHSRQDVWEVKEFLTYCANVHPRAQIQDYVKGLYQSEFGGGHMIDDEEASLRRLKEEIAGLTEKQKRRPDFDPLCSQFCRMNLSVVREISPELVNRIFVASAGEVPKTAWFRFEEKLRVFYELSREGLFAFTPEETEAYLRAYNAQGYRPVSHSEIYREAYEPAYRVVCRKYRPYLELYAAMEKSLREKGAVNVAIDGNCAAGKSELAKLLSTLWDCNVFHADDFFLPLEKRTPERMEEVGGNMERERLKEEVCEPVRAGKPFSYRPFDCSVMALGEPVRVEPKRVNIFEGSYSMHPDLREYYDVTVFLSVSPTEQEARILRRNGGFMLRRFLEEWIPLENAYFEKMRVQEACRFVY